VACGITASWRACFSCYVVHEVYRHARSVCLYVEKFEAEPLPQQEEEEQEGEEAQQ
jgi:hypothetical protein